MILIISDETLRVRAGNLVAIDDIRASRRLGVDWDGGITDTPISDDLLRIRADNLIAFDDICTLRRCARRSSSWRLGLAATARSRRNGPSMAATTERESRHS